MISHLGVIRINSRWEQSRLDIIRQIVAIQNKELDNVVGKYLDFTDV